jgi:hypothetical protein
MSDRRCNRDDQNTQPGSIVHNSKSGTALIVLLLLSAAALVAAEAPYKRPAGIADLSEPLIVAGYRALFTCSAHFFAGRPLEDIKKQVRLRQAATKGNSLRCYPIMISSLCVPASIRCLPASNRTSL